MKCFWGLLLPFGKDLKSKSAAFILSITSSFLLKKANVYPLLSSAVSCLWRALTNSTVSWDTSRKRCFDLNRRTPITSSRWGLSFGNVNKPLCVGTDWMQEDVSAHHFCYETPSNEENLYLSSFQFCICFWRISSTAAIDLSPCLRAIDSYTSAHGTILFFDVLTFRPRTSVRHILSTSFFFAASLLRKRQLQCSSI